MKRRGKWFWAVCTIVSFLFANALQAEPADSTRYVLPSEELNAPKQPFDLSYSIGQVVYASAAGVTESIPKLSLRPRLAFSGLRAGLDINILLTDSKRQRNLGNTAGNVVVFRYLAYENRHLLAHWGALSGLTFAQGLIVNNYDSTARATSAVYSNDDKMALLQLKGRIGLTGFWTQTQIVGGRLTYPIAPLNGLTLGGTYVTDTNQKTSKGSQLTVFGADLFYPIFGARTGITAEWAKIQNFGNGFSAGLQAGGHTLLFTNSYRNFDRDFQPSIFDSHYETLRAAGAPFTPGRPLANQGFLSRLDFFLPLPVTGDGQGRFRLSASYEAYNHTSPRAIVEAEAGITGGPGAFRNLRGRLTFEQQNFSGNSGNGIWKGELTMPLNNAMDLILRYTKTTDQNGKSVSGVTTDFVFGF